MKIIRLNVVSQDEMAIVVISNDYEDGMLEGLARWDGKCWSWLRKSRSRTLDLMHHRNQWLALDYSGECWCYENGKTNLFNTGVVGACEFLNGFDNLWIAGEQGIFSSELCELSFQNKFPTSSHLYTMTSDNVSLYVGGDNGTLIALKNGNQSLAIDHFPDFTFTSLSTTNAGTVYASGGRGLDESMLYDVKKSTAHQIPCRWGQIKAISDCELYGIDWNSTTWFWDGNKANHFSELDGQSVHCVNRASDWLAFGLDDKVVIKVEQSFTAIKFDLNSAFLESD